VSAPVLIVADGATAIGAGHQVRCAALAQALVARGRAVLMACRDLPGSTHGWAWSGLATLVLPAPLDADGLVRAAQAQSAATVVVIDHYEVGAAATTALAAAGVAVALIDDDPGRGLAGVVLVANAAPGVLPGEYPTAAVALGPAHALLRRAFAGPWSPAARSARILVMLGGTDASGLLPAAVGALLAAGHDLDVVTAPGGGAAGGRLAELAAAHPARVAWRQGLGADEIAGLMRRCRAGLLTPSSVVFEAAACGLPVAVLPTAGNQRRMVAGLAGAGVPVLDAQRPAGWAAALAAAAAGAPLAVDGRGADRVAQRLIELDLPAAPQARLRACRWDDAGTLLAWANDPETRAASFASAPIAEPGHRAWLAGRLADPEARLWIVEDPAGGAPVGTLRLARADGAATVSITVAPARRGQGWGGRMLAALAAWNRAAAFAPRLVAWVRDDNPASLALFATAGYRVDGRAAQAGRPATRFVLEPP
jgi:spore coat polysaccharide biosynthesis predicted glycosyltransferase SpsG/RimJ/RimL family protein N-acetyltransferase